MTAADAGQARDDSGDMSAGGGDTPATRQEPRGLGREGDPTPEGL